MAPLLHSRQLVVCSRQLNAHWVQHDDITAAGTYSRGAIWYLSVSVYEYVVCVPLQLHVRLLGVPLLLGHGLVILPRNM